MRRKRKLRFAFTDPWIQFDTNQYFTQLTFPILLFPLQRESVFISSFSLPTHRASPRFNLVESFSTLITAFAFCGLTYATLTSPSKERTLFGGRQVVEQAGGLGFRLGLT
jgi:hypothetical protein